MRRINWDLAAAVLLLGGTGPGQADFQAYYTADTTGNQAFDGNLGVDFNVNSPITITQLGAFDSGGLGFEPGITVGLFRRLPGGDPNTDHAGQLLASAIIIGTAGTVSGNYRFVDLPTPLTLSPGFYDVDAVGFNSTDRDLNEAFNDGSLIQTNDGGGLVSFVGSGRYDDNTTLDYPSGSSPGTSPHVFGGGSFVFSPAASTVPEPSSLTLLAIGLIGVLVNPSWRRRRSSWRTSLRWGFASECKRC